MMMMMMDSYSSGSAKRLDSATSMKQHKLKKEEKQTGQMKLSQLIALMVCVFAIVSLTFVECHIGRTQYHEQGLHGPKSYKFGYTSGDHKNPQERHEVSDGHGHVKGWYSFVDGAGRHQVVHYEAHPKYGFKVYNHKEKAYNNGKRHYNS